MDIRAGAAICRGPRNILARVYMSAPIGITVEGANILTRSMIIYGQGAIRCHPFVRGEMTAAAARDVGGFDRAFFGHLNFVATNAARALVRALTGSRLVRVPAPAPIRRWLQHLTRMSAAFALVSDVAMATLGGTLKRKEKLSGRLADALAWQYLASATVKRFHDEGYREACRPFLHWCCAHALYQVQEALRGVLDNLPHRPAAWIARALVFPLGPRFRPPDDHLGGQVARALLDDRDERLFLTRAMYVPPPEEAGLGRLEAALDKATRALAVEKRIRDAARIGRIDRAPGDELVDLAWRAGVITDEDRAHLRIADQARDEVIRVDEFAPEEYAHLRR